MEQNSTTTKAAERCLFAGEARFDPGRDGSPPSAVSLWDELRAVMARIYAVGNAPERLRTRQKTRTSCGLYHLVKRPVLQPE